MSTTSTKDRASSSRPLTKRRTASEQSKEELWKGLAAGLAAGAAASLAMNLFQAGMKKVEAQLAFARKNANRYPGSNVEGGEETSPSPPQDPTEDDAEPTTVKVAEEISEGVFDHTLTKSEKSTMGSVVHYAFGTSVGALYGGLAEYQPSVTTAGGLIYGAAVWATADETMLPALGLSKPPTEYSAEVHLKALAAHLVYGLSLEMGRHWARRLLDVA